MCYTLSSLRQYEHTLRIKRYQRCQTGKPSASLLRPQLSMPWLQVSLRGNRGEARRREEGGDKTHTLHKHTSLGPQEQITSNPEMANRDVLLAEKLNGFFDSFGTKGPKLSTPPPSVNNTDTHTLCTEIWSEAGGYCRLWIWGRLLALMEDPYKYSKHALSISPKHKPSSHPA